METRQERKERITQQRRAEILDAALAVFSRKGYGQATTRDIAEEAGIAEGTIYNYFEGKRGLLVSLVTRHILNESFLDLVRRAPEMDDVAHLSAVIEDRLTLGSESGEALLFLLDEVHRDAGLREQFAERVTLPGLRLMQAHLESRMAAGAIRPLNAAIVARALQGMLMGFMYVHRLEGDSSPIEEIPRQVLVTELTNFVLWGLKGRGDS